MKVKIKEFQHAEKSGLNKRESKFIEKSVRAEEKGQTVNIGNFGCPGIGKVSSSDDSPNSLVKAVPVSSKK